MCSRWKPGPQSMALGTPIDAECDEYPPKRKNLRLNCEAEVNDLNGNQLLLFAASEFSPKKPYRSQCQSEECNCRTTIRDARAPRARCAKRNFVRKAVASQRRRQCESI